MRSFDALQSFSPYEPVLLQDAAGHRIWFLLECGWRSRRIDQPVVPAHVLVGDETCGGKPADRLPVWGIEEERLLTIALPAVEAAARERDSLWSVRDREPALSGDTLLVVGLGMDYGVYRDVARCIKFRLRWLSAARRGHVWPTDDAQRQFELIAPVQQSRLIEDHAEQRWTMKLVGADQREYIVGIPFAPVRPLITSYGAGWKLENVSGEWRGIGGEGSALSCALLELCQSALSSPPDDLSSDDARIFAALRRAIQERERRVLRIMRGD